MVKKSEVVVIQETKMEEIWKQIIQALYRGADIEYAISNAEGLSGHLILSLGCKPLLG